jgi:hypothetical protein
MLKIALLHGMETSKETQETQEIILNPFKTLGPLENKENIYDSINKIASGDLDTETLNCINTSFNKSINTTPNKTPSEDDKTSFSCLFRSIIMVIRKRDEDYLNYLICKY